MPREVIVNGISYPSVSSASKALGVNRNTLTSRLNTSGESKPIFTSTVDTSLTLMGETFLNATEAASYFGINRATFYSRLKAGFKGHRLICAKSFKHRGKPVIVKGKPFNMVKDMLAHFNVDQAAYNRLLRLGLSNCGAIDVLQHNKTLREPHLKKVA